MRPEVEPLPEQTESHSKANTGGTISLMAAVFATTVGVTVLTGWVLGIDSLKSVVGDITMKANMAVGLIACGLALFAIRRGSFATAVTAAMFALLAGAIGGLTLSQHLFGWNLGIDELLFTEPPGAAATASPGRMGPSGSLNLILASLALLLLTRPTVGRTAVAQFLAASMAVLATTALTGYWYSAEQLYEVAKYTGIAFPTAGTLLVLSVGILAVHPTAGPVAVLSGSGPGGLMARRLLFPAVVLPLLLGYFRVVGQRAGLYDIGLGTAMLAISLAVLFVVLIWRTAQQVNSLDTERQLAEAASRASEESFSEVFRSLPVSVALSRVSDGVIVDVNEAFTTLTGFTRDEVMGKTSTELGLNRDDAARRRIMDQVRRDRSLQNADVRLFTKSGEPRDVITNLNIIDLRGKSYILSTILDITERKDIEVKQAAAREAAESANRIKDQFLATLSHELRTPLNAILGYSRMLRSGSIPLDKHNRAVEIIERNATAQNRLVEDLLDISRITSGRVRLETQPLLLMTPLQEALESLKPAAEAKRIAIEIQADPFTASVAGDPGRLRQVFWNVLSNAVKFTPEGGRIFVALEVENTRVRVIVRDSGIGVASEFLPHLFEPFRQADGQPTRQFGGLGLGLSICRELVELHGGTIDAESDGVGRGTTVTTYLPCYAATTSILR